MNEMLIALFGKPHGIVIFQLIDATQFTIYLTLIAFVGGGILAAFVTFCRIAPSNWVQRLSAGYVWLFQSTPLLMLLFLLGLGVPRLLGFDINEWIAAGLALIIYTSAYISEVWRGALASLPIGQWEGGKALGLSFFNTLRLIIVPQAFRLSIAPTVGFMVQIIKGTSLAYIIGFHDLMAIGRRWANAPVEGTEPFIIYPLMALIYFCLCFPLSIWSRRLEHRLGSAKKSTAPELA